MPKVKIEGVGTVEVGDEFLSMSPERQAQEVDEIANSLRMQGTAPGTMPTPSARGAVPPSGPALEQPAEDDVGFGEAFTRAGVLRVLGIPESVLRQLTPDMQRSILGTPGLIEVAGQLINRMTGGAVDPVAAGPQARETIESALSGENILAGGEAVLGRDFSEAQQRQQEMNRRAAEQQPFATAAGEMVGAGVELATGRAGLGIRARPGRMTPPPSVQPQFNDIISKSVRGLRDTGVKVGRAGQKAGEVGLEGAVLAVLDDGDPVATAGLAAAAQAGGSASLFLLERPLIRLLPTVATATVGSLIFQAVAPGDRNVFEATDFAVDKIILAVGLGTLSGLAGAGRLQGIAAERAPILADAINAVPRGALLSRLSEFTRESERGENTLFRITDKMRTNPGFFTPGEADRLGRAMNSKKKDALAKAVDQMRRSASFRNKLDDL